LQEDYYSLQAVFRREVERGDPRVQAQPTSQLQAQGMVLWPQLPTKPRAVFLLHRGKRKKTARKKRLGRGR